MFRVCVLINVYIIISDNACPERPFLSRSVPHVIFPFRFHVPPLTIGSGAGHGYRWGAGEGGGSRTRKCSALLWINTMCVVLYSSPYGWLRAVWFAFLLMFCVIDLRHWSYRTYTDTNKKTHLSTLSRIRLIRPRENGILIILDESVRAIIA